MNNEDTLKKNVLVQGSILAFASIIVRLIGLLYRIPLTRMLGDTAMGYYSYAYEIYNLALILSSYSLPLSVSKLVSARLVKGEYYNAHRVFKFSLAFASFVGALGTILLLLCANAYGRLLECPGMVLPLKVLAPTIFVFSVMGIIRGYFQGHHNMVPTALSQIIEQIINAIVSIAAAIIFRSIAFENASFESKGAAGGTFGTLSGAFAALLVLVFIYLTSRNSKENQARYIEVEDKESYKDICKILILTAVPVILSQTIYQISGTIDSIIYNKSALHFDIIEEIRSSYWGKYSNKYRLLTNVPIAIATALGTAIVPSLIAEFVKGDTKAMNEKIKSVVKFNMLIAFPSAFGLMALARPINKLIYYDFSDETSRMFYIGGLCVVFFASSTVTNGILQGINRMTLPVKHSAISLAIHVPLLMFLLHIMKGSILALVICNVIFPLVVSALNWRSIHKLTTYRQEKVRTFLLPCLASFIMGFIAYLTQQLLAQFNENLATILAIFMAVLVYAILILRLKAVNKEELLAMPKGRQLVKLLTKLRLLK